MNVKQALCQIEAHRRNLHGDALHRFKWWPFGYRWTISFFRVSTRSTVRSGAFVAARILRLRIGGS
jgi:hypothetical protein